MAKKNSFFDRVRIVYTRSPILLKCAVLVTLLVCIGALTVMRIGISQYQEGMDFFRAKAAQLENENAELVELIDQKDTVEGIQAIAEKECDMVDADTEFYDVVLNQN